MWYLVDAHRYFHERVSASFFTGLVAVFLAGGFSFLNLMAGALWLNSAVEGGFAALIIDRGVFSFLYTFFYAFVLWFVFTGVFILITRTHGSKLSMLDAAGVVGLGFVPILLGGLAELGLTAYYVWNTSVPEVVSLPSTGLSTHILVTDFFGIIPLIAVILIRLLSVIWAGYVWSAGLHHMGRVEAAPSLVVTGIISLIYIIAVFGIDLIVF